MHRKHETEIRMECASIISHLIGRDVIEGGRAKSGNFGWHSPDIWRNISASLRAYISSVERLIKNFQNLKEDIKEDNKKLKEVIKEEISHALPV